MQYSHVSCARFEDHEQKKMALFPVMKSRRMSIYCKNNYNQSELLLLFNNFVMEWKGWSAMEEVENGI